MAQPLQPTMKVLQDQHLCLYFETGRMKAVADHIRAWKDDGRFHGQQMMAPIPDRKSACRGFHLPTGSLIIFTKDINQSKFHLRPGFDCCARLQIQFFSTDRSGIPQQRLEPRFDLLDQWLDCFFGSDKEKVWCSAPATTMTQIFDVWTFRLFTNCVTGWALPDDGTAEEFRDGLHWLPYGEMKEFRALRDKGVRPQ